MQCLHCVDNALYVYNGCRAEHSLPTASLSVHTEMATLTQLPLLVLVRMQQPIAGLTCMPFTC